MTSKLVHFPRDSAIVLFQWVDGLLPSSSWTYEEWARAGIPGEPFDLVESDDDPVRSAVVYDWESVTSLLADMIESIGDPIVTLVGAVVSLDRIIYHATRRRDEALDVTASVLVQFDASGSVQWAPGVILDYYKIDTVDKAALDAEMDTIIRNRDEDYA